MKPPDDPTPHGRTARRRLGDRASRTSCARATVRPAEASLRSAGITPERDLLFPGLPRNFPGTSLELSGTPLGFPAGLHRRWPVPR